MDKAFSTISEIKSPHSSAMPIGSKLYVNKISMQILGLIAITNSNQDRMIRRINELPWLHSCLHCSISSRLPTVFTHSIQTTTNLPVRSYYTEDTHLVNTCSLSNKMVTIERLIRTSIFVLSLTVRHLFISNIPPVRVK